ncbi:MAG TPA: hypothetical protein VG275_10325 [Solirubrobacteraceae bacterium]|jgi:hypothetical protein|nr:hypothetical protein [Solirubrobacteraceae bacterium]
MSEQTPSPAPRPRPRTGARSTRVTDRDTEILAFAAEHRIVLPAHVETLLDVSTSVASGRLRALTAAGLLKAERILHHQPTWYRIARPGLAIIGSDLPPPRVDLRCYQHDIGMAWTWLAASRGAFGRAERIISEREMRSHDAAGAAAVPGEQPAAVGDDKRPFGIRLSGVGPRGRIGLHYPDLLLVGPGGERIAVELELSAKGPRRLESILAAYGADRRISAVLYLAEKPGIRRDVQAAAARLGISDLVHVQSVAWPSSPRPDKTPERARGPASRSRPAQDPARARQPRAHDPARARDPARAHEPARAHDPARAHEPAREPSRPAREALAR